MQNTFERNLDSIIYYGRRKYWNTKQNLTSVQTTAKPYSILLWEGKSNTELFNNSKKCKKTYSSDSSVSWETV